MRGSLSLGTGPKTTKSISDFDDEDEEPREDAELFPVEDLGVVDLAATNELLAQSVTRLRNLACRLRDRLHTEPDMGAEKEEDKRTLCELVATGNGRKLILAFTHFYEIKGDNLLGTAEKAQHVLASAENVLAAFGEDLGPYAERILRKRLEAARFFLADLQEPLSESTGAGRRTVDQLRKLLKAIDQVIERPQPTEARPVYDRMNLVLPIHSVAGAFQEAWRSRLGLESKPVFTKEHWTRIKALSRRLAAMGKDEYDSLRPVADLRQELRDRIYIFIQNPLRWEGPEPSEEDRQIEYDAFADSLSRRLLALSTRRVWCEPINIWERAYHESGRGSTFVRARIIGNDIYEPAAPVPDVTPSPDRNQFLRKVVAEVEAAVEEVGACLL